MNGSLLGIINKLFILVCVPARTAHVIDFYSGYPSESAMATIRKLRGGFLHAAVNEPAQSALCAAFWVDGRYVYRFRGAPGYAWRFLFWANFEWVIAVRVSPTNGFVDKLDEDSCPPTVFNRCHFQKNGKRWHFINLPETMTLAT